MTDFAGGPRGSRFVPTGLVALLASAALLQAFPQEERAPSTDGSHAASRKSDVPAQRVSTPQAYYGRQVTLRGVVGRVYGRQVFSFDVGTGVGADLLVMLPAEADGSVAEGLEVIVTGTVRALGDVYREPGSPDETLELDATLSRRPVVVARSARLADGTPLLRSSGARVAGSRATQGLTGNGTVRGASQSVTRGVTGTDATRGPSLTAATHGSTGSDVTRAATGTLATAGPTTISLGMPETPQGLSESADRIADNPDAYLDRRVVLTADVGRVEAEGLFVLDPDVAASGALLVLNPRPLSAPPAGARVTVSGTVRPYSSAELGRTDSLPPNADALLARYPGRPVVVADSIRTSDGRELVAALMR